MIRAMSAEMGFLQEKPGRLQVLTVQRFMPGIGVVKFEACEFGKTTFEIAIRPRINQ
ncbi:MAG: hypothetical protein ACKO0V_14315 [bacterium]